MCLRQSKPPSKDCAARFPELAGRIERALEYLERVEKEFQALCREDRSQLVIPEAPVDSESLWDSGISGVPVGAPPPCNHNLRQGLRNAIVCISCD